jgi:uncharacterized alkaline shock family protein YloU
MESGHALSSTRGRISVAGRAVAQIVAHTAAECYGVVALDGGRVGRLLARDTRGVEVRGTPGGLEIVLHVVVEYGLNLAEVAAAVRSRVTYEVERLTGLDVAAVEVHVADARRSARQSGPART